MHTTEQEVSRIFERITQLQADLEGVLKGILEQAGSIKPEGREGIQKEIEDTKQFLEHLKSKYV